MQRPATLEPDETMPHSRADEARCELLGQINGFFNKHALDVTSGNLATVCAALSGSKEALAEAVFARELSGLPIDQSWIDSLTVMHADPDHRVRELERLIDKMEHSLARFEQNAKLAQDQTTQHRGAIGAQIEAMEHCAEGLSSGSQGKPRHTSQALSAPHADLERVIMLSHTMLQRLSQIENVMERNHIETVQLRTNLAKARTEADVDHLTRLPNRRAFERRLIAVSKQAELTGRPVCVAMCDVDNFKTVNDTHGHAAGDRVLIAIASTLQNKAGDECFVARHGGEEFAVLFDGLTKEQAVERLELIRKAQARKTMFNRTSGKPFGKITFSAGVAEIKEAGDANAVVARADQALYDAKKAGRNTVATI